jgi:signal transduction histidine kinase
MRLDRRLLLHGVALPVGLMTLAGIGVGTLLERELVAGVDQALRTQAATESVSLFDRAGGALHFHAAESPVLAELGRPIAAMVAYGPDGKRVLASAGAEGAPEHLHPPAFGEARITTERGSRTLTMSVPSPEGTTYALWLAASLDDVRSTVAAFFRLGALGLVLVMLLLLFLERRHARWLAGRVERLAAHMGRIQRGDLSVDPPEDSDLDVLGELRASVAEATERLREARQVQERLVAGAAHELRTPLAAMRATLDVTLRRPRSPEALRSALEELRLEVLRLDERATDLLDLAALRERERSLVRSDLRQLADESVRRFKAEADERGVRLEVDGDASAPADLVPDLVRRAIDNLLRNALGFAPRGSRVRLDVRRRGAGFALRVEDEGPGVAEAHRASLFLPFHRVDRRRPGTGLGLALVKDVAELHGGRASLEGGPPGAVFCVWLPAAR